MQMSQLPPPGGDQPPVYQWLPDSSVTTSGDSASWLPPPGPTRPASPPQHSPTAPRQQRRRREGADRRHPRRPLRLPEVRSLFGQVRHFRADPDHHDHRDLVLHAVLRTGVRGRHRRAHPHPRARAFHRREMDGPARAVADLHRPARRGHQPAPFTGDAGRSGIIALAGPALGTVAALLCFLLAGAANPGILPATCCSRSRTSGASSTSST